MKKLSKIKKELKIKKIWGDYKRKYQHRQMKLLFSKVVLIYNPEANLEDLVELEMKFLNSSKSKQKLMFENLNDLLSKLTQTNADWKYFTIFIFYIFQVSTFYCDKKHKRKNAFNKDYIKTNAEKRTNFLNWMESVDKSDPLFNNKIMVIMKVVF